jgi:uncharacterized membrane protein YfcA
MTIAGLVTLLAIVAVAAYVQALTGFALGLVLMGGIALTGILPLQDAAVLSSLLVLVQGVQVLRTGWRDVAWRPFALIVVASAPGILAGYALLLLLVEQSLALPQLLLGIIILLASLQLLFKPEPRAAMSPGWTFSLIGLVSGLMSGLFATSGPPLVYHLYRQPLALRTLRETLVLIFFFNATIRIATVVASADVPPVSSWWALSALPMVVVLTYVARRWPPPLSDAALRRLAFALLTLSGLSLAVPAIAALLN